MQFFCKAFAPGLAPACLCDRQPEHILTRVSSGGPGLREQTAKASCLGGANPPHPLGCPGLPSKASGEAAPGPVGLSGAAYSEWGTPLPTVPTTITLHPFRT